jgi:hypothetical protein
MRWGCSVSEDGSELQLEGSRGSLCLLGIDLSSGDTCLKGCEGSSEVSQSSGGSRGGGNRGCHGSLLLL